MNTLNSERPWLIEFNQPGRERGKKVLEIFIEVAKKRCAKVIATITEEFSVHAEQKDMKFRHAEVWCEFFFKTGSGNYTIRTCTRVWNDLGQYICFTFEEGLFPGDYGTDWETRRYDQVMQYPFFQAAYTAFLDEVISEINKVFPNYC